MRANGTEGTTLVVGAILEDIVCHVPRLPLSGEGVVADSVSAAAGGCAYNSACAIKELGLPVFLFAPLGAGPHADFLRMKLADRGLSAVEAGDGFDNGACVCMVEPGGERTMLTFPGVDRHYRKSWFAQADVSACASVVVSGYEIEPPEGDAIVEFLEEHPDLSVYFGPGPRIQGIPRGKIARINALRPVWHLNDQEALAYTGAADVEAAGRAILAEGALAVVVTEGAKGSRAFTSEGSFAVPTKPVAAVDTVGAGDAHIGVVAALRTAGMSWEETLRCANEAAGAVCAHAGAAVPKGALEAVRRQVSRRLGLSDS